MGKLAKSLLAAIVGAVLLASPAQAGLLGPNDDASSLFVDLEPTHSVYDEVVYLSKEGIYGNLVRVFAPNDPISRQAAISYTVWAVDRQIYQDVPDAGFADVKELDSGYYMAWRAAQLGIVNGKLNENGEKVFDPYGHLTRAEMAKILALAFKLDGVSARTFHDVPESNWSYPYVQALANNGITYGYPSGFFGLGDKITNGQFALMLARALNPDFRENIEPPKADHTNKEYVLDALHYQGIWYKLYSNSLLLNTWSRQDIHSGIYDAFFGFVDPNHANLTIKHWEDEYNPNSTNIPIAIRQVLDIMIPSGADHIYSIILYSVDRTDHPDLNQTFHYDGYNVQVYWLGKSNVLEIDFSAQ